MNTRHVQGNTMNTGRAPTSVAVGCLFALAAALSSGCGAGNLSNLSPTGDGRVVFKDDHHVYEWAPNAE